MPTVKEILYAAFILVVVILVGYFLLEFADRIDAANIGWCKTCLVMAWDIVAFGRGWCHPLTSCG